MRRPDKLQNRERDAMAKKRIEKKEETLEQVVARLAQKFAKTDTAEYATAQAAVAYFERFNVSENGFLNILGKDGKDRFVDVTVHPKRSRIQRAFFAMLDAIDKTGANIAPTGTLEDTALRMKITGTPETSRNKIKIWLNRSLDLEVKTPTGELYKLADYMPTDQPRKLEEDEEIAF